MSNITGKGFKVLSPFGLGITTGKVYFVDNSNAEAADGGTGASAPDWGTEPNKPFKTIDHAIGQCSSGKGDVIYVMPAHTETLNSSGALVPDVAGISIMGIGFGRNRPIINVSTSGSDETRIGITGEGTRISNLRFRANSTSVGSSSVGISIGADYVQIDNCLFDHASTNCFFFTTLEIPAGSDGLRIIDNEFYNVGRGSSHANRCIDISGTGAHADVSIIGNTFRGRWCGSGVIRSSTDCLNRAFNISSNYIYNNSTKGTTQKLIRLSSSAGSSDGTVKGGAGIICNNYFASGSSATAAQMVAGGIFRGSGNVYALSTGALWDTSAVASS